MQLVVADETNPLAAKPGLAERRFSRLDRGMPVELDQALAFAATDEHLEALHRHVKLERLDPVDGNAQGIVAAQVVELGTMLALDRLEPHRLASAVRLLPLALGPGEPGKPLGGRSIEPAS